MTGYSTLLRLQRIEETATKLGFRLAHPKSQWGESGSDLVAVYPADDKLPVYSRDAELYIGTFESLDTWLRGFQQARDYDMLLRMSDDKKRSKAEDAARERQRKERERVEKRKMFAILSDKTVKEVEGVM